ncbi:hypothetical protein CR513_10280, partial [Mucuna pruriens]
MCPILQETEIETLEGGYQYGRQPYSNRQFDNQQHSRQPYQSNSNQAQHTAPRFGLVESKSRQLSATRSKIPRTSIPPTTTIANATTRRFFHNGGFDFTISTKYNCYYT